jgi:hypothetical protein
VSGLWDAAGGAAPADAFPRIVTAEKASAEAAWRTNRAELIGP